MLCLAIAAGVCAPAFGETDCSAAFCAVPPGDADNKKGARQELPPPAQNAAAELEWTDLEGRSTGLAALRGRPVLINFWATWCKPCVDEMPDLVRLHREYAPHGVEFLAASVNEAEQSEEVLAFVREVGVSFPVVLGADTDQMKRIGLLPMLPGTVLLDEQGRVAARFPGVIRPARVEQALDKLLGHSR